MIAHGKKRGSLVRSVVAHGKKRGSLVQEECR